MQFRKNGSGDNLKRRYKCLVCKNGAILEPSNHKCICPCGTFNNYVRILKEHERFIQVLNLTNDEGVLIHRGEKVKCLIQGKNIIELYFFNRGINKLRWLENRNNISGCLNGYRDSKYIRKNLLCGLLL